MTHTKTEDVATMERALSFVRFEVFTAVATSNLLVTANVYPSLLILFILVMEAIRSS
jgi:hypothetical protein